MKRIAIIPARGGSKRLARKNILPVSGQSMLCYPIQTALETGLFDSVMVSTEDEEIAEIALNAGADVINRPKTLAQDRSTIVEVCLHAISQIAIDEFCCIYATSVLLKAATITAAYDKFKSNKSASSLMGVSEYKYSPVQALTKNSTGNLKYMWPEFKGIQSQFHPELVVSNGTFVWVNAEKFVQEKTFYGEHLQGFLVPEEETSDIDTAHDYFRLQEKIHKTSK